MRSFLSFASTSPLRVLRYVVVSVFVLILCVICEAKAEDDLSTLVSEAIERFRPVSDSELTDAKAELMKSMDGLERFVRPSSPNGQRWLRYLRWEALRESLATEGRSDLAPIATTYRQLNRDQTGLELPQFRQVADALLRYMHLLQLAQQDDQEKYYRSQLERLQAQLEEYRREPSASTGLEIGSRLGFLSGLGGARDVVRAIRRDFGRPNAFLDVDIALVADSADPIDRRECITDCILGTNIRSDAHTKGSIGVASIPSEDRTIIEFISTGRTYSKNVGNNGPAVIRSNSQTDFTAVKRVELSDKAFIARPSRARASTDTHLQSVAKRGGGLGSRLVSNIGWQRARQSERQAEAIASNHAEQRIDRRFDDELNERIRDARKRYEDEYRRPLERRGELPEHIRFFSERRSLGVEVAQANRNQLGAAGPPPAPLEGNDLTLRLHETAVNNYSASLLSGATASQKTPDQDLQFDVTLPKWLKDALEERENDAENNAEGAPFKPYSLRFREGRPITVKFASNDEVHLTLHIARLTSGDQSFNNWDVTGIYKAELVEGGVVLRRDKDLEMLPANFRGSLSSRQVAERRNLEEELNARSAQGRGFPRKIEVDPLEPEGALADSGPLDVTEFVSEDGWLVAAWNRRQRGGE